MGDKQIMDCSLCMSPIRRTRAYSIFVDCFDGSSRLIDIVDRYLQLKLNIESQSCLICQSCYTHLDDFHKFALLIKEKQELHTNDIPTIKLEDSDDEDQDASYIRDTDVLVEFKTDSNDTLIENNEMSLPQGDFLMASDSINEFHNSNFYTDHSMSMSSFEQMSFNGRHDISKSKTSLKITRKTPYKTHTPEDRSRIVEAANRGNDWPALASELGVKYKTAYTWVSTSRKEILMKNGKNNRTFKEKEIDAIIQWIEDNRLITLKEIVDKVKVFMRREVCVYIVEASLEGRLYRHKRSLDYHPQFINTLENRKKRLEFVYTLKYYMNLKKTVVWLGETNFKMFCRRTKGRFNTNSTFAAFDPTIYIMGAISENGVIGISRSRDRIRPENIFNGYTKDRTKNLSNLVIVCDSDYSFSELDEYFNNSEVTLLLLSPYSFMVNPMEIIWNSIMSNVKNNPNMHNNVNIVKEQHIETAEKCIDQVIDRISVEDCDAAIKNSRKHYVHIMGLQDMPLK